LRKLVACGRKAAAIASSSLKSGSEIWRSLISGIGNWKKSAWYGASQAATPCFFSSKMWTSASLK
jgi:hypothetical protein